MKRMLTMLIAFVLCIAMCAPALAVNSDTTDDMVHISVGTAEAVTEVLPGNAVVSTSATSSAKVVYKLSVKGKYGLASGLSLYGTCYCTKSGDKTSASFSVASTFYRSDDAYTVYPTQKGKSTSSKDYTWYVGDDYTILSTSTSAKCSKSGYQTKTLKAKTKNPHW